MSCPEDSINELFFILWILHLPISATFPEPQGERFDHRGSSLNYQNEPTCIWSHRSSSSGTFPSSAQRRGDRWRGTVEKAEAPPPAVAAFRDKGSTNHKVLVTSEKWQQHPANSKMENEYFHSATSKTWTHRELHQFAVRFHFAYPLNLVLHLLASSTS